MKMNHNPTTCEIMGYVMYDFFKKEMICNDVSCKKNNLMSKFKALCEFM